MRVLKITLWGLLGLLVLTVAAGGGLLAYVQGNDMGPLLTRMAKDKAGYTVVANGPVRVKLFPNPELHTAKLSVTGPAGGRPLVTLDSADVRMAWGGLPALWKGMRFEDIRLENPTVYLVRNKKGVGNWQTPGQAADERQAVAEGKTTDKAGFNLGLGKANIDNLNLTYLDETTGRNVNVRGLNVQTDARDLAATTLVAKGTINGQPLEAQVQVNATDLDKAPVKLALALANLRLNAQGEVIEQETYRGDVNIQSPDVRATYTAALGAAPAEVPSAPLSLTGHVVLGGGEVGLSSFALRLGELLRVGGELAVKTDDDISARGTLQVQGNNLRALAALAGGKANPKIPALPFSVQTTLSGEDVIKLTKISAQLADLASLTGDVTVKPRRGKTPEAEGQLSLRAASTRALGLAFGLTQALPAQPLTLSTSFEGGDEWKLPDLALTLSNLLSANANVTVKPGPVPAVNGSFDLSGNDLKTAAGAFGVANAKLPGTRFTVKAQVAGDKTIDLKDLSINLPGLAEAKGTAQYTPGTPADMKANLTVKKLDLTALGPCAAVAGSPVTGSAPAGGAVAGSGSPFSNQPLDLGALKSTTFTVDVDVDNLDCARWPVTTFKGNLVNTREKLSLNNIRAGLAGGMAQVQGTLTHSGTPDMTMAVQVQNVPVEKFVSTLRDRGVALPVNVEASFNTRGASTQAMASHLAGSLNVTADDGRIPYTNLLGGVSNVERMLSGDKPVSNGSGKVEKFVARYDIDGGVAKTKEFSLVTDGSFSATGTGDIDIGGWSINYTLTPTVAASNQIAVPVLIKGSLSAPSIGPDPAFIQRLGGRLVKEGLKALDVGGDKAGQIGGAVGGIISGQGVNTSETQQMIEKGLNNLFKNIGR